MTGDVFILKYGQFSYDGQGPERYTQERNLGNQSFNEICDWSIPLTINNVSGISSYVFFSYKIALVSIVSQTP